MGNKWGFSWHENCSLTNDLPMMHSPNTYCIVLNASKEILVIALFLREPFNAFMTVLEDFVLFVWAIKLAYQHRNVNTFVLIWVGLLPLVMDREERIKNACKKIVECINAMSFVNLDDQRVHSLVLMREIARGVVENRDRKVRKRLESLEFIWFIMRITLTNRIVVL